MKTIQTIAMAGAAIALLAGCSTVPITGRSQLKLVPEATMIAQSATSYQEVVKQGPLSQNKAQAGQIKRVGARISAAVEQYFSERGQPEALAGFEWEFNLIEDETPNAWCMPGGKVVFYTGILPFTKDDSGVAVVMGHEIAHAVAGHGTERVSHQMLQQGGGLLTSWLSKDSEYHDAIVQVYGLASQVGGVLPYSRLHESEADHMGIVFMAMAGYNPEEAVGFWQRMASGNSGAPLEFMSTHPSDETRIRKLREKMPEALHYYRP